jgi:hypothetical protein
MISILFLTELKYFARLWNNSISWWYIRVARWFWCVLMGFCGRIPWCYLCESFWLPFVFFLPSTFLDAILFTRTLWDFRTKGTMLATAILNGTERCWACLDISDARFLRRVFIPRERKFFQCFYSRFLWYFWLMFWQVCGACTVIFHFTGGGGTM